MSSQSDILIELYQSSQTVFTLREIAMMVGGVSTTSLSKMLNYQAKRGRILNVRKGIYAKPEYKIEELAASLYTPSYLSLEYVLQKAGVVFQFDERITMVSYLNRTIEVDGKEIIFRQMKGELLAAAEGVEKRLGYSIATPERAFLDAVYLNANYYFDNVRVLNKSKVMAMLPIYNNRKMEQRVRAMFDNVEKG